MYDETIEYLNELSVLKQELQELLKTEEELGQKKKVNVKWFGWKTDNIESKIIQKKRNTIENQENVMRMLINEISPNICNRYLSQILILRYIDNKSFLYIANALEYTSYPKASKVKHDMNKKFGIKSKEELQNLIQESVLNKNNEIAGFPIEMVKGYLSVYNDYKSIGVWYVKNILHRKGVLKLSKILCEK